MIFILLQEREKKNIFIQKLLKIFERIKRKSITFQCNNKDVHCCSVYKHKLMNNFNVHIKDKKIFNKNLELN